MIQAIEMQTRQLNKSKKSQIGKHEPTSHAKDPQRGASAKHKTKQNNNNKNKYADNGSPPDGVNVNFCLCHGWNTSHVMDQCKVLKAEAKKLKCQYAAGSNKSRKKTKDAYARISSKDLNVMIDDCINLASKKKSNNNQSITFTSLKKAQKFLSTQNMSSDSSDSK